MNRFRHVLSALIVAVLPALPAAADDRPALVPIIAAVAPANPFAHRQAKAPADEYFGQLKLSILGVKNVVTEIDARADTAADDAAHALCRKLVLAEDALRDWQAKYPDDAWIPKFGYAMLKDYEKIDEAMLTDDTHAAGTHAVDLAVWLELTYPDSEYAPK